MTQSANVPGRRERAPAHRDLSSNYAASLDHLLPCGTRRSRQAILGTGRHQDLRMDGHGQIVPPAAHSDIGSGLSTVCRFFAYARSRLLLQTNF